MKKLGLIGLLCVFIIFNAAAQHLPQIDRYKLDTDEDCVAADKIALQVADYLFQTPFITDDDNRLRAGRFLNKWMEGTPTYTFMIDEDFTDNFEGDPDMLDMYMAALTRFTLQNPDITDDHKISAGAMKQVIAYAADDANNVLLSKRLQKLVTAAGDGKLEKMF
ncbi:MAG: hypothetical protein EOP47_17535 [Sphingobacteriaceae bacterium]|nr:MAG: hypothetical protein EOP47_17535 [Sphingobacteriaceae bacterium]